MLSHTAPCGLLRRDVETDYTTVYLPGLGPPPARPPPARHSLPQRPIRNHLLAPIQSLAENATRGHHCAAVRN